MSQIEVINSQSRKRACSDAFGEDGQVRKKVELVPDEPLVDKESLLMERKAVTAHAIGMGRYVQKPIRQKGQSRFCCSCKGKTKHAVCKCGHEVCAQCLAKDGIKEKQT